MDWTVPEEMVGATGSEKDAGLVYAVHSHRGPRQLFSLLQFDMKRDFNKAIDGRTVNHSIRSPPAC